MPENVSTTMMISSTYSCTSTNNILVLTVATLLEALVAYARQYSQYIGHHFTATTIRLTALTGAAATEINGETTYREFQLNSQKDHATIADLEAFADTRLNVVDEVSFASYTKVLARLSSNLQAFTECNVEPYGKIAIVFLGDFCQLEAIQGDMIYTHENGIYWEQALTCMVELKGTHRFRNCEMMKRAMPDAREHGLSDGDRKLLNTRVIGGKDRNGDIVEMPDIAATRFATFFNRTRCDINQTVFKSYLKAHHSNCNEEDIPGTAVVIRSNPMWHRSKCPLNFDQRKVVFEQISEADTARTGKYKTRLDPLLCLFRGSNVMGTSNDDVKNGIANGTTSTFRKVCLKAGKTAKPIKMHGYWVKAVDIGDVDHIELEWQDCHFKGTYKMFPTRDAFTVKYPIVEFGKEMRVPTRLDFDYFAIIINHATTGHKLQGKSMDALVIAEWSKTKNWAYVVLSRVRTLEGLYFLKPIPTDIDFRPMPLYLRMMERLRNSILVTAGDVADLHNIIANQVDNN